MPTRAAWLELSFLRAGDDLAFLLLRLLTGAFLLHGVWDNIESAARMQEFVGFLRANKFIHPELMAPLSVWGQLFCGVAFLLGALTRWAGLICALNFVVACAMVHWHQDLRGWWPAAVLIAIGLVMATHGAGRFSLDEWYARSIGRAPAG
ncbi:DoxX family protein [Massilia glaciei]|uniref:DoxX family protein n=1 Tax=Massilia glaciei TaxID=1524097 RepID=A0A2U2HG80_9BURK|nr:DoxX family protein [Massilia glaciei]PWF43926.1 DoxX family protein [Massilia glaciei]